MWFRPFGFKLYATIFGCNLDEIEFDDLHQYESLGEFFYRRLKEGSRPIDTSVPLVRRTLLWVTFCALTLIVAASRVLRLTRSAQRMAGSSTLARSRKDTTSNK
jgi:phosphatidylserine decarboxylase